MPTPAAHTDARDRRGAPAGLSLPARVVHREFLGSRVRYALAAEPGELLVDASFSGADAGRLFEPGDEVTAVINPAAVRWLTA